MYVRILQTGFTGVAMAKIICRLISQTVGLYCSMQGVRSGGLDNKKGMSFLFSAERALVDFINDRPFKKEK